MKALVLIASIVIFSSCKTSTLYDEKIIFQNFDCQTNNSLTEELNIVITASDIKNCYFLDTNSITWIHFFYNDCMHSVKNEVKLFRKYSNNFKLLVISLNYDIGYIKKEERENDFPIYFIPLYTDRMRVNLRRFVIDIFGEEIEKETTYSSDIFVYKGKILKLSHNVTESVINEVLSITKEANE